MSVATTNTEVESKPRVLLVDDDRGIRYSCGLILKKAGYSVVDASCADQAQVAWGQVAFDILVTDYDMPGRNGVELAELLRSQKPDLNVVLISGLSLEGVMLPCGVRFLQKPFTTADFLKTLIATPLSDGKSVTAN